MRSLNCRATTAALAFVLLCAIGSFAGMSRTSEAGLYQLELQLEPAQPVVGSNAAVITVFDAHSGRTRDDVVIKVAPWMTVHGHGSPNKPTIRKTGTGQYRVENLIYTMEGDWDLLVTIENNHSRDTAILPIVNVKNK